MPLLPRLSAAAALLLAVAASSSASAHLHHNHHHELHQLHDMHAMQAHRDLAASAASSTDYTCPVCGMSTLSSGYDNKNYVTMKHGQTVFSCGMAARSFDAYDFDVTDTAYLAANMAEFIVNQTDASAYAKCETTCSECADGISDPVSGAAVSSDSFVYVCLNNGQKIYFASQDNKNSYLASVNSEVRYLVDSVICSGATCSDATNITTLSPAAQSFVADYSSASASGTTSTSASSTATESDSSSTSSGFCTGQGSVMFNGFQSSIHGSCVMLLFQPWVLNSGVKYAFGFIGCFLIALLNESLVKGREVVRQRLLVARKLRPHDKFHKIQCKLALAVLYMIQMTIAYFAMLVVMTYETGLFVALICGFGAGFLLFKNLDKDITEERGSWRFTDASTVRIQVEGMSCMKNCGTTVENALKNTPGVTDAVVEFDERAAYVSGSAQYSDLVAAIEAVGFTAEVNNQTGRNSISPRAECRKDV